MGKYIGKGVLPEILTIFIIGAITFFAMNAIRCGSSDKKKASIPPVKAQLEAKYNLDKPLPHQHLLYMRRLLNGDLGVSLKR